MYTCLCPKLIDLNTKEKPLKLQLRAAGVGFRIDRFGLKKHTDCGFLW